MDNIESELLEKISKDVDDAFSSMEKSKKVIKKPKQTKKKMSYKKKEKLAETKKDKSEERAKRKLRGKRVFGKLEDSYPKVDEETWEDALIYDEFERNRPDKVAIAIDIMGALLVLGLLTTGACYAKKSYDKGYEVGSWLMQDLQNRLDNNKKAEMEKWGPYYYILHPEETQTSESAYKEEGDEINGREIND